MDMDTFGRRITARLSEANDHLPHDVAERLRAARVQAVEKRKQVLLRSATTVFHNGNSGVLSASYPGGHSSWWQKLGSFGLLFVLVCGLYTISLVQDEIRASELADIDTAILIDDLPPAAYRDVGFSQFLKNSNHQDL